MCFKNISGTFKLLDGNKIPCVGFGTCNVIDGGHGEDIIKDAITCGYRHFDTAALYNSEQSVGIGIKESGINRDEFFCYYKSMEDRFISSKD